ncbi:hypothetical protein C9J03_12025 [Photobacterium gaetbulicola]|nr:hypothetical protein [Photobacterium gaetbulicola]PSU10311.1 hypothetical protein C9J03_12025 [Photobacterium gaetbulicola]
MRVLIFVLMCVVLPAQAAKSVEYYRQIFGPLPCFVLQGIMTDIDSNYHRVSEAKQDDYRNQVIAINQLTFEKKMFSKLSQARWVYAEGMLGQCDEAEIFDVIDQVRIGKISCIPPVLLSHQNWVASDTQHLENWIVGDTAL